MSLLKALFGPNQDEVWRQLCQEIGAEFVEGGFWRGKKVQARVNEWTVTLDTYTSGGGGSDTPPITYTRLRAPYVNKDGFRFEIYRKSVFSGLGKMLGMQDIEVGYADFDEAFIIKGNDVGKVRQLFSHAELRELLAAQPRVRLAVTDCRGRFRSRIPERVDQLYFEVAEVLKDVERLKALYRLFALTLHLLCHLGSAYEDDPGIRL